VPRELNDVPSAKPAEADADEADADGRIECENCCNRYPKEDKDFKACVNPKCWENYWICVFCLQRFKETGYDKCPHCQTAYVENAADDDGAASGNDSDDDSVASESEIGGAFARSAAGRG